MSIDTKQFEKDYSEDSFWEKLKSQALKAGNKVVYTALLAFFALQSPNTPTWARVKILAALGYFISPIDLVPDAIPVAGYADDLSVLLYAIGRVAMSIDKEVREKARKQIEQWFGSIDENDKMIIEVDSELSQVEKANDEVAVSKEK